MSVYRVAVCEDEAGAGEQLAELCRDIFETWGVEAELSLFPTADRLDAAWEGFELYLLDIQMDGTDGLELARRLYERGVRDRVVFITGSAEYALAGYSVHPLDYLLKPVDREALEQALRRAWERRRPRTLPFRTGGRTAAAPAEEVRYLESRNHAVTVHRSASMSELPLATSLMEAERHTPSEDFARCHKSYLVNLARVTEMGRSELRLRDGERLPVSRAFYAPFQSALVRYLNR